MQIGIDLGTTNTALAVDGNILNQPREGSPILPSVVAYPPSGATLVGSAARRRRSIDAKNTLFSSKRLLGRVWNSDDVTKFTERYPFDLVCDSDNTAAYQTRAGVINPIEVAATVLRSAREAHKGGGTVAIAVPSKFQPAHRAATREAARRAGLGEVRIIDEPIATSLAYLAHTQDRHFRYAVAYDLGGGTFDFAVIDCSERMRILAHGGDLYLGGDDIDLTLAKWAAQQVLEQHRWDLRQDAAVFARLVEECERAKMRLSDKAIAATTIQLSRVEVSAPVGGQSLTVERAQFERLAWELVQRTFVICDEILHRAGVKPNQVEAVFPAGGSTLLPQVREGMRAYFGVDPHTHLHPMHVVSAGASLADADYARPVD